MPGRGRPWKGVGFGVPDRIGTGAISDGSITEADLNSSVTSKLNSGSGYDLVEDEGTPLSQRSELNFVGAGVVASDDGEKTVVTIAGGGGTNYQTIQDEGTPLSQRAQLNFIGAGVTATDDGENTRTNVTIPGGGSLARDTLADPFTEWWFYDEFFYPDFAQADDQFSHLEVSASGKSVPSSQIGGVVQIQTSTSIGNRARINTCGAGLVAIIPTKKFRVVWKVKKGTATTEAVIAGLTANQSEPMGAFPFASKPSPIIIFLDEGTGNYRAYTDDGSTVTNFDTGVAVDTATHTFDISFDGVSTLIFKIDGATVQTQTVDIPTGNLAVMTICQTSDTSAKTLQVDSLFIFNER